MVLHLPEFTTEQWSVIAVIVTVITVLAWFQSDFTGIQRVTATGFAFLAATVGAIVGSRLFGWPE